MTTLGATVSTTTFPSGSSSAYELDTTATVGGSGATNLTAIIADIAAAAAAGGGTVKLGRGTYDFGVAGTGSIMIVIPSNVRVLGAGKGVTIVKTASTTAGATVFGFGSSVTNSSVEGLTVDGVSATVSGSTAFTMTTATHCSIKNVRVLAKFSWGTYIGTNSLYCKVLGSTFDGSYEAHSVEIGGASYCTIDSCVFLGASGQNCIELYDGATYRVVGNKITNNLFLDAVYSSIVTAGDLDTVIANNVIMASQRYGIFTGPSGIDGSRLATNLTIIGNTILGCNVSAIGAGGIYVDNGVKITVSGNAVRGTAGSGPGMLVNGGTGGSVSGNVFSGNGGPGLNLNDGVTRCAVIGNQFIDNSGNAVDGSSGMQCTGTSNSIIGNTGIDTRGASNRQVYGISVSGASNTVVGNRGTGNRFGSVNVNGATCTQMGNDQTNTPTALHGDLGFYGTTPIAKQTGVAVSAAGIHAACVALGLFAA